MKLSKRKLESYKRAEMVAREARAQLSMSGALDQERLTNLIVYWMRSTGSIKWDRPNQPKLNNSPKEIFT